LPASSSFRNGQASIRERNGRARDRRGEAHTDRQTDVPANRAAA
jgi:hypothetical protein